MLSRANDRGREHARNLPVPRSISPARRALAADTDAGQPDHQEARDVLVGLARGCFGAIAPERVADHVLAIAREGEWPVKRAALAALARRFRFAERDELRVVERPKSGVFGSYRTKSAARDSRTAARPYETALLSLEPLRTSCSCPDYVRSSLGLCKHGLIVLETLERARRSLALAEAPRPHGKAVLTWNPWQPLFGSADRLARIAYLPGPAAKAPVELRRGRLDPALLRDPKRRAALIDALDRALRTSSVVAEPALRTVLAEERAHASRRLSGAAHVQDAMRSLSGLSRKLYPYQREAVQRFFEAGRLLLADDMGLGKTTQAIAACHGLFATRRVRRGLLIVPSALKPQWRREWEATTPTPLCLVDGSPDERARQYRAMKTGFLLIAYEQLLRDFAHVQRFAPELVVLDEAQRIKNWATKSAAYVKALSPDYRLVLTGTPMENRFEELASIMDFVDDLALEPKWRLAPFHDLYEGDSGKGKSGVQHLDVLRERLAGSMIRRVRQEVLAQLPGRTDTRVPVEMTEVQRAAHDDLRQPIAQLAQKSARRPLTPPEFLRLMQLLTTQRMICNGMVQLRFDEEWPEVRQHAASPALLERLFSPKLSALRAVVEQVVVGQGRKAIVFSQWRNMLRFAEWAVRDLLQAAGKRAVFFTGAESPAQRERAIVDFHDDATVALMFLSDAGGVGLNLQRAANCCINLELPWNPAVLEQRIGRIYRLGQSSPVDVYNLVSEEGIETRIADLIRQKSVVFSSLFDGTSDAVRFEGQSSFMKTVQKLVEPVEVPPPASEELEPDEAQGELALAAEPASTALVAEPGLPPAMSPEAAAADTPGAARSPSSDVAAPERASEPAMGAFQNVAVTRVADGGIRIEAPAELAAPLLSLLESLTQALRESLATPPAE